MSATSSHGAPSARHQPEVDEIVLAQVQLADAAGALDDDHVEAAREVLVGREHLAPQLVDVRVVVARATASSTPARCTTTWLVPLPFGFSRIGFIAGSGSSPHASACATCARPISPPPRHGYELFDMFCALNGATRHARARAATRRSPSSSSSCRRSTMCRRRRAAAPARGDCRRNAGVWFTGVSLRPGAHMPDVLARRLAPLVVCLALAAPAAARHTRATAALGGQQPNDMNGAGVLSGTGTSSPSNRPRRTWLPATPTTRPTSSYVTWSPRPRRGSASPQTACSASATAA